MISNSVACHMLPKYCHSGILPLIYVFFMQIRNEIRMQVAGSDGTLCDAALDFIPHPQQ